MFKIIRYNSGLKTGIYDMCEWFSNNVSYTFKHTRREAIVPAHYFPGEFLQISEDIANANLFESECAVTFWKTSSGLRPDKVF